MDFEKLGTDFSDGQRHLKKSAKGGKVTVVETKKSNDRKISSLDRRALLILTGGSNNNNNNNNNNVVTNYYRRKWVCTYRNQVGTRFFKKWCYERQIFLLP